MVRKRDRVRWYQVPPNLEGLQRRPRFPGPRQVCPHCGLPSDTTSRRCPVCDAWFEPSPLKRWLAAVRRRPAGPPFREP